MQIKKCLASKQKKLSQDFNIVQNTKRERKTLDVRNKIERLQNLKNLAIHQ